jgi:hypothetical protein
MRKLDGKKARRDPFDLAVEEKMPMPLLPQHLLL